MRVGVGCPGKEKHTSKAEHGWIETLSACLLIEMRKFTLWVVI